MNIMHITLGMQNILLIVHAHFTYFYIWISQHFLNLIFKITYNLVTLLNIIFTKSQNKKKVMSFLSQQTKQ